jgi:hypothetical protein
VIVDVYPAARTSGKPLKKQRAAASGGTFTVQLASLGPGTYNVTARTAADASNAAGVSAPVPVTIV